MKNIIFTFLILFCSSSSLLAKEVVVKNSGLIIDLPATWFFKIEETKVPTGQIMQRWIREPIKFDNNLFKPGLIAISTDVPADSDLMLLTQDYLRSKPFEMKLGVDTDCIKCVRYKFKTEKGVLTVMSFEPPPNCIEYSKIQKSTPCIFCIEYIKIQKSTPCIFKHIRYVNLGIEPSWVLRVEKSIDSHKMFGVLVHTLLHGKFITLSFWYPSVLAESMENEIGSIISTIKTK